MSWTPTPASGPTLAAALLCVVSCEQREFRYETTHLRIETAFSEPLCQGDLDHMELVIASVEDELGITMSGRAHVYLWAETEWPPTPNKCVTGSAGCIHGGEIHSTLYALDHELVHAATNLGSRTIPIWSEGTAEALSSTRTRFPVEAPIDNLELDIPELSHRTAGHFVRWLLETHGAEKLRTLLDTTGDARVGFENTYRMTIEAAQEQFFAEAPYSYGAFIACDFPDLDPSGDLEWHEEFAIDCADPDVRGGPYGMGMPRVLTITEPGYYAFSTTASRGSIGRCDDEDLALEPVDGDPTLGDIPAVTRYFTEQYVTAFPGDGEVSVLSLAAGRYEVHVGFTDHETRSAAIDVRAAPGPIPQTPESPG